MLNVDLSGRVALITGGAAGIGRAITEALAQAGAAVCIMDLNPDRSETTVDALTASGARATAFHGDVANRFQMAAAIEHTRETLGSVNILINAAAVYKSGAMLLMDEWDWRRGLDVNLTGSFFASQLLGRVMADAGGGVILNIGAAHSRSDGVAFFASKAGVAGLTQQTARELAPYHIRCNALLLGDVGEADMPAPPSPSIGTPEDAAQAALFLCSDAARFITGQTLILDGGASLK